MGLFKAAGRLVGRFMERTGEIIGSDRLETFGRKLTEKCTEEVESTSRKTAEQDSYDEEAAGIAETTRINAILSEFSLNLAKYADELEQKAIRESSLYFDELIDVLENNQDNNTLKINTSKIMRNQIQIEKKIRGSFKKYLSKRVSIDDSECLSILKLRVGKTKRDAMRKFGNKVLKEAANNLCSDIQTSILDQHEYLETCFSEKMDEFMKMQDELMKRFDKLEQAYEEGKEEIDKEKNDILSKIAICEVALSSIAE